MKKKKQISRGSLAAAEEYDQISQEQWDTAAFKRGVLAAAALADDYNASTTLEYRLGDIIACKFNATRRNKPRRNDKRVKSENDVRIQGMALALSEVHRHFKASTAVKEVARDAGLTIKEMKKAGVDAYDWKELRRAGVKER